MNTTASTSTDWNAFDNASFRATLREFFEEHFPSEWRYPQRRLRWSEIGPWYLRLSEKGWVAPSWPGPSGSTDPGCTPVRGEVPGPECR